MSSQTIYLVTGAGRGIGLALVEKLASDPNNIIFAGVRDTTLDADHALAKLVANKSDAVHLIKISSANRDNNEAVALVIKEKYGKVDVIIANAGSHSGVQPIISATAEALQSDFTTNTIGPLILFQSFASLLKPSKIGKFVTISSTAGQIADSMPWPLNGYGLSKAGANYIAKKINQEVDYVTSFPIHPGVVTTDMTRTAAADMGAKLEDFGPITTEESASKILDLVAIANKASHGGRFWSYDGSELTY